MPSVHDLAAYILARQGEIGTMKLQKLVYYCQAWSLVWDGSPIFPEPIEAWEMGPVVRDLYAQHRGRPQVASLAIGDAGALDDEQRATIEAVLRAYGSQTEWWLKQLAHAEQPWVDTDRNQAISTEEMAAFYSRYRTTPREIPPEVVRGFDAIATLPEDTLVGMLEDDAIEVEGLERWLETGEGDPWQTTSG